MLPNLNVSKGQDLANALGCMFKPGATLSVTDTGAEEEKDRDNTSHIHEIQNNLRKNHLYLTIDTGMIPL